MLDAESSAIAHALQNVSLILLSLLFLPLDTAILTCSFAAQFLLRLSGHPNYATPQPAPNPRTILVTGVGMTKGLTLARLFYKAGHRVIGADFERNEMQLPGKVSRSLSKFYTLAQPSTTKGSGQYNQDLLDVILKEKVDLWVSCSRVVAATTDGEAKEIVEYRTSCRAVQFDLATTQTLHEKHTFMSHTQELGLKVPESHTITSRKTVDETLSRAPSGRRYIMKTIGMNDQARGDMKLLPLATDKETKQYLDGLHISEKDSWILQQFIDGEEYCSHALVVRGQVKAFVACPSSELLMHYRALAPASALSRAMLDFSVQYAAQGGKGFTGHLSFDFLIEDSSPSDPKQIILYPIECNPRAHTAVALFNDTPAMVESYLSILDESEGAAMPSPSPIITPATTDAKCFWMGHDLVANVFDPILRLLLFRGSLSEVLHGVTSSISHFRFWRDGTFELWDPFPWFFLYHIYWPMQFLACLRAGKKWSRVNVSTLKMFGC